MRVSKALLMVLLAAPILAAAPASGPHLLAPEVVSTGDSESHATLSPDGATLLFLKLTPDFSHWTVVSSRREGATWGAPEIAWFSGRWDDADVSYSPDGATIYFVSNRPDSPADPPRGDTDLFRMRRGVDGWGEPERLAELSSPLFEWFPNQARDGTLYFGSERREGNFGPEGTSDLWRARSLGDHFAPPENLGPALNGPGQEIEPWISADGDLLIFAARGRSDSLGSYDLYAAFRCAGGEWSAPRPLAGGVNSPAWEFAGRMSPDGSEFYFASNRRNDPVDSVTLVGRGGFETLLGRLRAPGNGLFDVYTIATAELGLDNPCAGARKSGG